MWIPKLRIRVFNSHFPQVLVSISFAGHKYQTYVKISKQAKHKAYLGQEMEEGPNTYGFWGPYPSKQGLDPTSNRPHEGDAGRRHPGCERTQGVVAPPPCCLLGPPFRRWCIECPQGWLHGYLPRIFPQTILGEQYKQGEASLFQHTSIHKRRRKGGAPLISLASS